MESCEVSDVLGYENTSLTCGVLEEVDPDALIVDVHLGAGATGIEVANILKAKAPWLAILAVSHYPNPESAGLPSKLPDDAAFLNKSSIESPQALVEALEAVLTNSAHAAHIRVDANSPLAALTPTQMDVLRLVAMGWSNAEIAEQRGIALRSTEQLIHKIFSALGVNDDPRKTPRVEAVMLYAHVFGIAHEAK